MWIHVMVMLCVVLVGLVLFLAYMDWAAKRK